MRLDVRYVQNLKPGDIVLGFVDLTSPMRPVRDMAFAVTVETVQQVDSGYRVIWKELGDGPIMSVATQALVLEGLGDDVRP